MVDAAGTTGYGHMSFRAMQSEDRSWAAYEAAIGQCHT